MLLELVPSCFCNCSHMLHKLLWNQMVRWIPDYLTHKEPHLKDLKPNSDFVHLPSHTHTQLLNLNQPFLPGASWWSPSWLHLSAAERPAMLMNFLPELSNASRARGFFSKNNIRDGLVGRFPSKQWGYFMASQLKHLKLLKWYLLNH